MIILTLKKKDQECITWINDKINSNSSREKISCRKLSKLYYDENNKKLSKTKIHKIIKNKLNLRYLKTNIKTSKCLSSNSIFMCFCFIKIIVRVIRLGFTLLYMDESSLL